MVGLFRLLTASDFDEMKNYGAYLFYRVGYPPDSQWAGVPGRRLNRLAAGFRS